MKLEFLRSAADPSKKFPWLVKHGRLYYASFYLVTGLAMLLLGLGFLGSAGTIVSAIPLAIPFALGFVLDGLLMFFLALTVGKDMSPKSWRTRMKKSVLVFTGFLLAARGIVAASLTSYAFWFALIAPLWSAFVIIWVAPLIWYLPTELDEFLALRKRIDESDKEIERLQHERNSK